MTKIEVNLSAEYGIMFLHDGRVRPKIPPNAGKGSITYTSTCVAFCVLHYVDGDAQIVLADGDYESEYHEYFSGEIACPSKSLSLSGPNDFAFASVPLADSFAKISLHMSEERNPYVVECVVHNMLSF